MAYSMQYRNCRYDRVAKKRFKSWMVISAGILIMIIIFEIAFPLQANYFRKIAFPFFNDSVQKSFSDMANHIREGEPVDAAVKTFCEEILLDASG